VNRRSFFRLAVGAAVAPLISKPLLALVAGAEPIPLGAIDGVAPTYGNIGRLSTPFESGYSARGTYLTAKMVRDFNKRMARLYE